MPLSFNKSSAKPCAQGTKWTDSRNYYQDPWAPFAINAVYSLVLGTDKALKDLCGESQTVCDDFRNSPEKIIARIKESELDLFHSRNFSPVFDDNGEGRVRFKIYNVQPSPSNPGVLRYVEVGHSVNSISGQTIRLEKDLLQFPDSTGIPQSKCPNSLECEKCQKSFVSDAIPQSSESTSHKRLLLAVCIILSSLLLMCVILLGVVCVRYTSLARTKGWHARDPVEQTLDYDYPTELSNSRRPIEFPQSGRLTDREIGSSSPDTSSRTYPREESEGTHCRNNIDGTYPISDDGAIFTTTTRTCHSLESDTSQTILKELRFPQFENPTWEEEV